MPPPQTPDADLAAIEQSLQNCIPASPESLYDPVRYILESGGKRVRPMLVARIATALGATQSDWLPAATAIELLHTFTLVHDDIMDHAPTRRGRPTLHERYNESDAILAGDVLVALSLDALSQAPNPVQLLPEYIRAFRTVCEGQALDKAFESRTDVTTGEYLSMIEYKTAALLECAAVAGALSLKHPTLTYVEPIRRFAKHLGIAFQIMDDLLDLTANHAAFGKVIGGDVLEGKRTYLLIKATESAAATTLQPTDEALLHRVASRSATESDIAPFRELMHRLGILSAAQTAAEHETKIADDAISTLPNELQEVLKQFAMGLLHRSA